MRRALHFIFLAGTIASLSPPGASAAPKAATARSESTLTVAILDFEATSPANPELGKQISEAMAATLSGQEGFTLVDRVSMARTLAENELNMTGLVDANHATRIGKLVGAKILVTGKIFPLDKQLYFTAKLVGTETTRISGVLVKGDKEGDTGEMMLKLAEKVAERLREAGPTLIASPDVIEDPLPALKKGLAGRKLPKITVRIDERRSDATPAPRIDPAVETELIAVLKEAGFTVIHGDTAQLAEAGVTVIVSGEAISEFAARIGNLINCAARVELKVTDRKTGEVLFTDRETTRAIDLAETIASKTALQKAARKLAIRMLHHFDETLPAGK